MCFACPGPPSGGEWCQLHHCDGAQHGREVYPTETDGAHCGAGPAGEQSTDKCGGCMVILCYINSNLLLPPPSLLPPSLPPSSVFPSTLHPSSCCLLPLHTNYPFSFPTLTFTGLLRSCRILLSLSRGPGIHKTRCHRSNHVRREYLLC